METIGRNGFLKRALKVSVVCFALFLVAVAGIFASGAAVAIVEFVAAVNWLVILIPFMAIQLGGFALSRNADPNKQVMGAGVCILGYAVIFTPLLWAVISVSGGIQMALQNVFAPSLISTISAMALLIYIAQRKDTDFSILRNISAIGSVTAFVAIVVFSLTGFQPGAWFAIAMLILISISTLWEVDKLSQTYRHDQYIGAGVSLFGSFVVFLWYVICLFTGNKD